MIPVPEPGPASLIGFIAAAAAALSHPDSPGLTIISDSSCAAAFSLMDSDPDPRAALVHSCKLEPSD